MNSNFRKQVLRLFIALLLPFSTFAQMPHDAIYMPKKTLCTAFMYGKSDFKEYWEGSLLRNNLNIGTNTTQSFSIMPAYGLTDRLNIIAMLPYITTKNSAGNLLGQRGLQDISVWLKYKLISKGGFSLGTVLGASTPVTNYLPDFLPMSIGLQSRSVSGKIVANYTHKSGIYATAHGTYMLRSNIKIDRDAYQAFDKIIYSNQVNVPHAADAAARLGYTNSGFQAEIFANYFTCISGDNIRRNDMPFPTNKMQMTSVGIYAKYQYKNIGLNAQVSQVLLGLNMGKSLSFSTGILWQIDFNKKAI